MTPGRADSDLLGPASCGRGRRLIGMVNVHPDAWVSPHAILTGEVTVGAGSRVLDLAVIHAVHGPVVIGSNVIVMEHAVLRGRVAHPVVIGDSVLVGPRTHLNGTHVEDEVFIATGASMFPGSRAGAGSELRINSVLRSSGVVLARPARRSVGGTEDSRLPRHRLRRGPRHTDAGDHAKPIAAVRAEGQVAIHLFARITRHLPTCSCRLPGVTLRGGCA